MYTLPYNQTFLKEPLSSIDGSEEANDRPQRLSKGMTSTAVGDTPPPPHAVERERATDDADSSLSQFWLIALPSMFPQNQN